MSELVDRAFASVPPEQWATAPARTEDPRLRVRRLLAARVCPVCGMRPKEGRRLLCATCKHTHGYCSACERVAPLDAFHRPTAHRAARGALYGIHKPCANLSRPRRGRSLEPRYAAAVRASALLSRARGRVSRAHVIAAVLSLGGPTGPGKGAFWDRVGAMVGRGAESARAAWRVAVKYGEVEVSR